MGEVYRARDSKLKREVALKVLPDVFARDPGRMVRFQREAEVLAALSHPEVQCEDLREESRTGLARGALSRHIGRLFGRAAVSMDVGGDPAGGVSASYNGCAFSNKTPFQSKCQFLFNGALGAFCYGNGAEATGINFGSNGLTGLTIGAAHNTGGSFSWAALTPEISVLNK